MFDGWMGSSKPRLGWVVAGAVGVLALVAIGVPLVSLLYVGVLLLCPLMMAGMHGGHGHGRGHEGHGGQPVEESERRAPEIPASAPPAEESRT